MKSGKPLKTLVVLISGTGRNLKAIIDACAQGRIRAEISAVISNRPDAKGLGFAEDAGIETRVIDHKTFTTREAFDRELLRTVNSYDPDLVALAGFMKILDSSFVQGYKGRLFNIHPSLLPRFPGLNTHQRVLEAGDTRHGASVHYVTEELDGGPVILQGSVDVEAADTESSLADRVMQEVELKIYPLVLKWAAGDRIRLADGQVLFDNERLKGPLELEEIDYA